MLLPARLLFRRAIATRHIGFSNGVKRWCLDAESAANLIYRNCTFLAHAVVCVSDAVAKEARDVIPKARVVTIFNWVPFIPPFQCKPARRDGILHLLFVGRLEKRKGLALLLQALEMLNGIDLTVVGDGEDRPKLVEMAGQKPVRFVGYQADPRSFYEQTDVFVMPSLGPEGMPLVSLEAMSHGVPCILSDLDVHKEISENGRAALLFSKGDVLDLREKIRLLSREPAIRSRIAGSAYRLIQANYSPEAAKSAYMRVFGLIETNSASAQKGEDFYR
jgi:glycosyltransferase involved in cell wall biosynthesis